MQTGRDLSRSLVLARRGAELWMNERQDLGKRAHTPDQGALEEHTFGGDQPVLFERGHERFQKHCRRTRLGEKSKHVAVVDGADRRLEVRLARKQQPDRVR